MKLADIQPILTVKEHELLLRADKIHEDPNIHTNPDRMRTIMRLMKMGLLRQLREPEITRYEITDKGKVLLNHK